MQDHLLHGSALLADQRSMRWVYKKQGRPSCPHRSLKRFRLNTHGRQSIHAVIAIASRTNARVSRTNRMTIGLVWTLAATWSNTLRGAAHYPWIELDPTVSSRLTTCCRMPYLFTDSSAMNTYLYNCFSVRLLQHTTFLLVSSHTHTHTHRSAIEGP